MHFQLWWECLGLHYDVRKKCEGDLCYDFSNMDWMLRVWTQVNRWLYTNLPFSCTSLCFAKWRSILFFLKLLFWYFQIFEKIISGMYLGEIVCRVLCRNVSVPCVKQSFYWIYTHSCCEDDRKCVLLWGLFFCWPTVSLYFPPSYLWFLCLYSSFLCFCYVGN
jgi:hypothetical protein